MYLFSRTRQAKSARILDAMPSAVAVAEKVTQITGLDIYVWSFRLGQPVGTLMWSCRLDSRAQLFEATEKMMADSTYLDMALSAAELYEGPMEDRLMRIVSGTPSPEPRKYIEVTQATMTSGHYADALQFGVEMQEYIASEHGIPTMFATAQHGGFADVGWVAGYESIDQLDELSAREATDEEYLRRIQGAAGYFVEGSGQQALLEKLN